VSAANMPGAIDLEPNYVFNNIQNVVIINNSFKNVLVNETENQLVIRFNTNSYGSFYIKTIIDLKDNKMRIRMYDEELHTFGLYFTDFYTKNIDLCCVNSNGVVKNLQKREMDSFVKSYVNITSISKKINEYILNTSNSKKEENW
jgi:hypothetical protein